MMNNQISYCGFWKRVAVSVIDDFVSKVGLFLLSLIALSVSMPTEETPLLVGSLFGLIVVVVNIVLYFSKGKTIGDYVMKTRLVDAKTLEKPSFGQLIGRFFAKIISAIPLGLGFMWAGWSKEKTAWHDSMSGTRYIEEVQYSGGLTWLANVGLIVLSSVLANLGLNPQLEEFQRKFEQLNGMAPVHKNVLDIMKNQQPVTPVDMEEVMPNKAESKNPEAK
ncbi:hypothetical protein CSB37_01875 [bacterium DOLZORAL124_38_8]|nr:MAG: hypothetical protein CSB37_01875 [bacterium DOLZORAL124_38_8]